MRVTPRGPNPRGAQVYFAKKQKNADGSVNGQPVYLGWDGFVAKLAPPLRKCLAAASPRGDDSVASLPKPPPAGSAARSARLQCAHHDNVLGWSLYDDALAAWADAFGAGGVFITFTESLSSEPLRVLRAIEAHVGLAEHAYSDPNMVYNSHNSYGWAKASKQGGTQKDAAQSQMKAETHAALRALYAPSVQRLAAMVRDGTIEQPLPAQWRERWGLGDS